MPFLFLPFSLRLLHCLVTTVWLTQSCLQAQILDPQTPRLPGLPCVFGNSNGNEYDAMLEHRMLSGKWIFVGYGCKTLQWMLRFETSQTFIVALLVCLCFGTLLGAVSVVRTS